ncbi:hypothetical protein PFMC_06053, partial [Plasmodium falciparum CAMP/Malaysia]
MKFRRAHKIHDCKNQHDEHTHENCCKTLPKITDDDEENEDQEQTSPTPCGSGESSFTNPCVDKSGATPTKTLTVVATDIQEEVHKKMVENSGTDSSGESKLKGDISRGKFYEGRKVNYLEAKQICDITIEHSNAERQNRAYKYEGPCTGKNQERFKIGKEWSYKNDQNKPTHPEAYMPQRREHMCTSNLEHLDIRSKGLSNGSFASHTLLGDVLIAAKYEAENIKKRYQQNEGKKGLNDENDKATVCRAIRYSFADIGDIIRGRDLWERNGDMVKLQGHLKTIFGTIHKSPHSDIKKNYMDNDPDYKQLRSDWWEANRRDVWKAMQCATKNGSNIKCGDNPPFDDYIPQRLRWMTEWAEWFCKAQNKYYGELEKGCQKCKVVDGKCVKVNGECANCATKCKQYAQNVKKWEDQWTKIKEKYEELYQKATQNGVTSSDKDADVVKFLEQLQKANNGEKTGVHTVYSTAAGYIHQEAKYLDCKTQTQFCEKKNGVKPSNGREDNNYSFRHQPHDHEKECNCQSRNREPPRRRPGVLRHHLHLGRSGRQVVCRERRHYQQVLKNGRQQQVVVCRVRGRFPPPRQSVARSATGTSSRPAEKDPSSDEEEEEDDEDDSDEEDKGEDEAEGEKADTTENTKQEVDGSEAPAAKEAVPPTTTTTQDTVDVCEMVKALIGNNNGINLIGKCNGKYNRGKDKYPGWNCDSEIDKTHKGACMPPRRQKLCIYYFGNEAQIPIINSQDVLRDAFIKSAAGETFLSWQKYKTDNNNDANLQNNLESGIIPEDFKRQMFYTFGDLRDFFFGSDISKLNKHTKALKANLHRIFNDAVKTDYKGKRETWWKAYGPQIWKGMLCGLSHASGNKETVQKTLTTNPNYKYETVKFSGDNTTTLEKFAKKPQFLRWMIEWGEEFCKKRKEQLENLKDKCPDYTCSFDTKKQECENHCKVYEEWLKDWKTQYEKQSEKFTTDKEKPEYKDDPDVASSENAHKYLSKKLKQICQNESTTDKCYYNCMEYASRQPQTSACSQQQQQQNKSSTQNHFPEAFDCPPKEIGDRCNCPKLPEPKYCVDKTAYDIRKEAETKVKNIDDSMKGKGNDFNIQCNKVNKNNVTVKDSCNFEETYKKSLDNINETCKGKGVDRLKIGQKWNSKYITKIGKDIFIPPRREYICLHDLNTLMASTIHDRNDLLKKIQDIAKIEGDDIIKKLLPQYPCNEDVICKAMKYSFADLGDIIRGRDMLLVSYDTEMEKELQNVFSQIQNSNDIKTKYPKDNGDNKYAKLREAWWDANRKDIWKAMTCNAPDEAKIYITKEGGYISPLTWTKNHCGHNDDPPDYDYIPQPLRWISEWSESYCLAQKDFLETMKNCENCKKKNDNTDCEQTKYGACRDCKKKCEEYKKFIEIWKNQFETQKKAYEEIYKRATTSNGRYFNSIDEDIKKFVEKLEQNCQKNSVDTADKYLEGGSVCRRFKFVKTDTHEKNYAFHNTPLSYKEHCECAKNFDPLDECPVDNNECKKYGIGSCPKKNFHKKLEEWTNYVLNNKSNKNKSAIVPPRRRQLCLQNLTRNLSRLNKEKSFKEGILISAASEAKMLTEQYRENPAKALQAIKYSFADIGNIIKGDDIIGNVISVQLNKLINGNKKINTSTLWWEANKEKIWNAMMCYYTGDEKTATSCPSHGNIDKEDQFLLWFQEWGENFCARQKELYEQVKIQCGKATCKSDGTIEDKCKIACKNYSNFISGKQNVYELLKRQYDNNYKKNNTGGREAHNYLKITCKDGKCDCIFQNFIKNQKWEKPYETLDDNLKSKCQCIKKERTCSEKIHKLEDEEIKEDAVQPQTPPDETQSDATKPEEITPKRDEVPPKRDEVPPKPELPSLPEYDPTNDILKSTIPVGIALALGSIAFLFIKKKPKSPVDLIRVLDIHKGDYGTPTPKSSNKYIPYVSDTYKGKTYLYVEGDTDEEKYMFMSDTTDITSSESEYEEMDINDIYVPGSPKYKTLIEVVLEPSKRDTQNDIPSDNTP